MPRSAPHALDIKPSALAALEAHGWKVESSNGPATAFHERVFSAPTPPVLIVHRCDRTAVVLGSSQSEDQVDHQRVTQLGLEVCRRRSGGGLVVVEPENSLWIDLVIPPTHHLSVDDVMSSFDWLGSLWSSTLTGLGVADIQVHSGRLVNAEHGRIVCFAGLGPGEVLAGQRKVVGLSQRRGRFGARFQCLLLRSWPGALTKQLIRPAALPTDLDVEHLRAGLDHGPSDQAILDQFISGLVKLEVS